LASRKQNRPGNPAGRRRASRATAGKPAGAPLPRPSREEIRGEEEHLRRALEAGEIGTWEWDLASGRMRWSAQMFRNLGLEPRLEPGDGDDLYALLLAAAHPGERARLAALLAGFRGRLGPMRIEVRTVWPGGDIHWIVFLGRTEPDKAGRPAVMRGITIDGTRRRRSEEPFRLLAERLRLAMAAGRLATWEIDLGRRLAQWSPEAALMHGCPPQALEIGLEDWLQRIDPADREVCEKRFAAALMRPGDYRAEYRVGTGGAAARWIAVQGTIILDAAGRPFRVVGVAQDISERKRAEAALRDSERRLRELAEERARQRDASRARLQAFFDSSPDWLTLFRATKDGHFVYEDLNRATERGYGLSRDRVLGRRPEEILGEEAARLPLSHMRRCIETGENQHYTARRTMAGVTRAIDVMFVRVRERDDGPPLILATARDISELEAMQEQLRQAQKMEALGQLTGGVAHDFNNLLTAIVGNLELLGERVAGDALAAKYVGAAERAAENGARLTEHLLAFSRRQHLRPRKVDLNAVIGGMHDLLARTIGAAVEVETRLMPELWPVLIDATQIEIAILNLAVNARDAMPLGGTVAIETRNIPAGREAVPSEIGDGDCVCLSVRDTGSGMSEEVLRAAVEPFFTTKEVGKGSGLGLSQVYGVVQQSKGGLVIDSRIGKGTSVSIYLPRAAGAAGAADEPPEEAAGRQESGRVLIVDDDAAVREVAVQMLRQIGYGVAEADGGQAALDALARGETCDLAVIDIAMPGLDGIETARRARAISPDLRVLYMTGYTDPAGANRRTGNDPLLKKPFRLGDLREAVRRALRRAPPGHAARAAPPDGADRRASPVRGS
jgi:PAS domain S-box-containing protein